MLCAGNFAVSKRDNSLSWSSTAYSSESYDKQLDFLKLCDILLDLRDFHRVRDHWILRWYNLFLTGPASTLTKVIRARLIKRLGKSFARHFALKHLFDELR